MSTPVTYWWLMTCQWQTPDGDVITRPFESTFTLTGPVRRSDVYKHIRNELLKEFGVPTGAAVLLFDIQPDVIGPAGDSGSGTVR